MHIISNDEDHQAPLGGVSVVQVSRLTYLLNYLRHVALLSYLVQND